MLIGQAERFNKILMIAKGPVKEGAVYSTMENGGGNDVYSDLFHFIPDGVFQASWDSVQGRLGHP